MKKLLIFLVFIIFSSNVYADAKFAKDLKKVSNESAWEIGLACGGEIAIFLEQIN